MDITSMDITKLVMEFPNKWLQFLQTALFSYNNTVNKSTGFSPGYLFYGRTLRNAHDIYFGTSSTKFFRDQSHYACSLYWELREIYSLVRSRLGEQQQRCKRYYDRRSNKPDHKIGDYVVIYMPLPVSERANNKFKSRLLVLYQIIQVISDQNHLLEELASGRRKVVHHDLMRYISGT